MRAIIDEHMTCAREEQQRGVATELPASSQLLRKKLTLTPILTRAHDRIMRRSAASTTDDTGALFDAGVRRRSSPVESGSAQLGAMVCLCSNAFYTNKSLQAHQWASAIAALDFIDEDESIVVPSGRGKRALSEAPPPVPRARPLPTVQSPLIGGEKSDKRRSLIPSNIVKKQAKDEEVRLMHKSIIIITFRPPLPPLHPRAHQDECRESVRSITAHWNDLLKHSTMCNESRRKLIMTNHRHLLQLLTINRRVMQLLFNKRILSITGSSGAWRISFEDRRCSSSKSLRRCSA